MSEVILMSIWLFFCIFWWSFYVFALGRKFERWYQDDLRRRGLTRNPLLDRFPWMEKWENR